MMRFISFSFSIVVDLFPEKIAKYTYINDIRDRNVSIPIYNKCNNFSLKSRCILLDST